MDFWKALRWGATALIILIILAAYLSQGGSTEQTAEEQPQAVEMGQPATPAPSQSPSAPTFNTN